MGKKIKGRFSSCISWQQLAQCLEDLQLSPVTVSMIPYSSGEYTKIFKHLGLSSSDTNKKRIQMMLKRNCANCDTVRRNVTGPTSSEPPVGENPTELAPPETPCCEVRNSRAKDHTEVYPPPNSNFLPHMLPERKQNISKPATLGVSPLVKPNTGKHSASEFAAVKPNTGKHSASDPAPVKPNTKKHSAYETPAVKPNTGKHSALDGPAVKPNTRKHSASDPAPVKPNTKKHSASETPAVKPNTGKHSALDGPVVKPNTTNLSAFDGLAVKPKPGKASSSGATLAKPNVGKPISSQEELHFSTVKAHPVASKCSDSPKNISAHLPEIHSLPASEEEIIAVSQTSCENQSELHFSRRENERQASKSSCNIHLGTCRIEEKNWTLMWEDGELIKRKYGHGLSKAVSRIEPGCVIICDRHNIWKRQSLITVSAHCNHKGCRRYRLVIDVSDPIPTLDVYCDKAEKHHGKFPEWRPVNGPYRKSLYDVAQYVKPLALRDKMTLQADEGGLSQGNAQEIQPTTVFSQIAYEAKGQNDLHSDPLMSVLLMRREQKKKRYKGVQYIWVVQDPLAVYIYCMNRLQLFQLTKALHPNKSSSVGVTLHLDATGSIVRKVCLSDQTVYYYALVFKYTAPEQNTIIPLSEFISSNHDAISISNWLSSFMYFAEQHNISLAGHFIVLDVSYAELNAVVIALNGLRLWYFLQILYAFVAKGLNQEWVKQARSKYVIPHLDYAHFKKNMAQSIKKHFYPTSKVQNDFHQCLNDKIGQGEAKISSKTTSQSKPDAASTTESEQHPTSKVQNDSKQCPNNETTQDDGKKSLKNTSQSKSDAASVTVSDFKKNISQQAKKNNLTKPEYKLVKSVLKDTFTLLVHTSAYSEMKIIFHHFFTLLLFSVECPAVIESKRILFEFCDKSPDVIKHKNPPSEEKSQESGTKKGDDPPVFFNVKEEKIKYKQNPFYKDFEKIFSECIKSHTDFLSKNKNKNLKLEKNIFFNPPFAIYILTYYTHIVALWSALLLPQDVKLNNGVAEVFFNLMKNNIMGGQRNIRVDRFLHKSNDRILAVKKRLDNNVPDQRQLKNRSGKRKRQSVTNDIDNSTTPAKKQCESYDAYYEEDADEPAEMEWMSLDHNVQEESPSRAYSLLTEEKWYRKGRKPVSPLDKATDTYAHIKKHFSPKSILIKEASNSKSKVNDHSTAISEESQNEGNPLPAKAESIIESSLGDIIVVEGQSGKPGIEDIGLNSGKVDLPTGENIPLLQGKATGPITVEGDSDCCLVVQTQKELVEKLRVNRTEIVERNQMNHAALRSLRGLNFSRVLSVLANSNCTFQDYIQSVLSKNGTVMDIEYYGPVQCLHKRSKNESSYLPYLVSRNNLPDFASAFLFTFENFSVLSDKGHSSDLYLSNFIIHAITLLFVNKYNIDERKVFITSTTVGSFVFNDDFPPEWQFHIPPTTELMIMPYCQGQKLYVPPKFQRKGDHWCMVVVNLKTSEFYHLDPLSGSTGSSRNQLNLFLKFLKVTANIHLISKNWSYPKWNFPKQVDNYNCGVFILFYTQCVLKNYPNSPSFLPNELFCPAEYRQLLRYLLLAKSQPIHNYCFTCQVEFESDRGKRDTVWISCDYCSRYVHVSDECLNDPALNSSLMKEKARKEKKVDYICYLCKKSNRTFKAIRKMEQIQRLKIIFDKYILS